MRPHQQVDEQDAEAATSIISSHHASFCDETQQEQEQEPGLHEPAAASEAAGEPTGLQAEADCAAAEAAGEG
jgi:hypothetical protein